MLSPKTWLQQINEARHPPVKDILSGFNGVVRSGEMLCTYPLRFGVAFANNITQWSSALPAAGALLF